MLFPRQRVMKDKALASEFQTKQSFAMNFGHRFRPVNSTLAIRRIFYEVERKSIDEKINCFTINSTHD